MLTVAIGSSFFSRDVLIFEISKISELYSGLEVSAVGSRVDVTWLYIIKFVVALFSLYSREIFSVSSWCGALDCISVTSG